MMGGGVSKVDPTTNTLQNKLNAAEEEVNKLTEIVLEQVCTSPYQTYLTAEY